MASQFVVTAALVITKNPDGSDKYLYNGAVVPETVSADEIKRLSDEKFIAKLGPKDDPGVVAAESN